MQLSLTIVEADFRVVGSALDADSVAELDLLGSNGACLRRGWQCAESGEHEREERTTKVSTNSDGKPAGHIFLRTELVFSRAKRGLARTEGAEGSMRERGTGSCNERDWARNGQRSAFLSFAWFVSRFPAPWFD